MGNLKSFLRSVLALAVGLAIISVITELIEFALVSYLNGSITMDQDAYFEIRNRAPVLLAKLFYNSGAAWSGGFITAWIARQREVGHGIVLAAVQGVSLIWAMNASSFSDTTQNWVWLSLILLMSLGIIAGAMARGHRTKVDNNRLGNTIYMEAK